MKHGLLISAAAAVALCAAAAPAVAGVVGNTSFSVDIKVPVPAGAQKPQVSSGTDAPTSAATRTSAPRVSTAPVLVPSSAAASTRRRSEPGSTPVGSGSRSAGEPGDDRGVRHSASSTSGRTSGGETGRGGGTGRGGSDDGGPASTASTSEASTHADDGGRGRRGGDG